MPRSKSQPILPTCLVAVHELKPTHEPSWEEIAMQSPRKGQKPALYISAPGKVELLKDSLKILGPMLFSVKDMHKDGSLGGPIGCPDRSQCIVEHAVCARCKHWIFMCWCTCI